MTPRVASTNSWAALLRAGSGILTVTEGGVRATATAEAARGVAEDAAGGGAEAVAEAGGGATLRAAGGGGGGGGAGGGETGSCEEAQARTRRGKRRGRRRALSRDGFRMRGRLGEEVSIGLQVLF
jgi:hypothetical protein